MFPVFTLNTMGTRQTKHDNDNLQRASWDLHQIQKQHIYIYIPFVPNQLVKILQTNCFVKLSSSSYQGINAFLDMYSPSIVSYKFQELLYTL